jgi:hypothetical protein
VVGEAHGLVVIDLAQGRIHGQADGVAGAEAPGAERGQPLALLRVGRTVERVDIAGNGALRVREVQHRRVVGKGAGRGGARIGGVGREEDVIA